MSEIKLLPCPFCGVSLENVPPSKVFYHVDNGCILSSKNFSIGDIEKWNTRKPMQEIVERLEEEREKSSDRFVGGRSNGKTLQMGITYGIEKTIRIVKEVGGMND